MAALAPAAKQGPVHSDGMPDQETNSNQQPVVVRQGGNGLGTVIAAVIVAALGLYLLGDRRVRRGVVATAAGDG